jgi:hypothetical protein
VSNNILALQPHFTVKSEVDMLDFLLIHPFLLLILSDINFYCYKENIPFTVTRIVDAGIPGISISKTHEEGRAFDMSVHMMTDAQIKKLADHFNAKYATYGALSLNGIDRAVVVIHASPILHGHIQIRKDIDFYLKSSPSN